MRRIRSDFLAACPDTQRTFERLQSQVFSTDAFMRRNPGLGGNGVFEPRWFHDRTLPHGVRTMIAMTESARYAIAGLADPDMRPIIVSASQFPGLFTGTDPLLAYEMIRDGERMPFPLTWFEVHGINVDFAGREHAGGEVKEFVLDLAGVLARDEDDCLYFTPVFSERLPEPSGRLAVGTTFAIPREGQPVSKTLDGGMAIVRGIGSRGEDSFNMETCGAYFMRQEDGTVTTDDELGLLIGVSETTLPLVAGLAMLYSSVNVEPREIPDEDLTREQRRAVKRGAKAPLYTYVRQRRSRSAAANPGTGRKLRFRTEVAGHFKHWGSETRMYRVAPPSKHRLDGVHGWHVRYWSPPHVRGPEDAPLRLRVRRFGRDAPERQITRCQTPTNDKEES